MENKKAELNILEIICIVLLVLAVIVIIWQVVNSSGIEEVDVVDEITLGVKTNESNDSEEGTFTMNIDSNDSNDSIMDGNLGFLIIPEPNEEICRCTSNNPDFIAMKYCINDRLTFDNKTQWENMKKAFFEDKFVKDYLIYECPDEEI